jgi:type IV pilus assembly protein PilN
MPRINLLPIKAARRQVTARNEMFAMMALIGVSGAGIYFWYSSVEDDLTAMRARISAVDTDIGQLTQEVKKVEELKKKEEKVKRKLQVIRQLITNRTGPARMLDELATIMTSEAKRVWLTKLEQKDNVLTLQGGAMDHEDISEFQMALQRRDAFTRIKLKKVKTEDADKDTAAHLTWELECTAVFKG